jgi:RNA polymerase sigma factor (sigma-70 family)
LEALSDNSLMAKVRDGDLDKLGLLFMRYKKPLFTFFLTLVRDRELGEDMVQNTFLRILKYRHLFRGDGDFKSWMFHIARNVKNDQFRKKQIDQKDQVEKWEGKIGHNENRDTEWMLESEHQMLASALDRLPEEKREILMLSKYQDRNYKEIGLLLGCSEGAVKVKVFRALQELKSVYQKLEKVM